MCVRACVRRNVFLSAGADGTVKLFNLQEKQPKLQWEPRPPPGSAGAAGPFAALSAVQFSFARPLVFGAASGDGFVYIYDLSPTGGAGSGSAPALPVAVLECLLNPPLSEAHGGVADTAGGAGAVAGSSSKQKRAAAGKGGKGSGSRDSKARVSVTGLAFNPKQRKLVAACDYLGRVHIWKLSWNLSSTRPEEEAQLRQLVGFGSSGIR